jgi:hypothetical protein
VTSNGAPGKAPFRVTLDQRRLADALADALSDRNVSVHAEDGSWIVSIDDARSDRVVVCVLDAIRGTLASQPSASALIQLDGYEYVMRGEDHIAPTGAPAPTADETIEAGLDTERGLPHLAPDAAAA